MIGRLLSENILNLIKSFWYLKVFSLNEENYQINLENLIDQLIIRVTIFKENFPNTSLITLRCLLS